MKVKDHSSQARASVIKDQNGNVLNDKDEVMGRWTEYCAKRYWEDRLFVDGVTKMAGVPPPAEGIDIPI